ncbi:trafficking protein particle complex subunit 5 [Trichodelitschia bisporula]|uniref:Trafficking protein particle complex subunit n=1 Tax=Trichodelitschia bisporula TaxID=703511 RepID=A0A6G1HM80_9PEZI|nr:trafficking protein particle complex subunit 5 [Trichodelitschia bisporula]
MTQPPSKNPQTALPQQSLRTQSPGLRYPTNKKTIYDRNLNRTRTAELSRASFAYLFVEMISYAQRRVTGVADLEKRLNLQGYPLGLRLLDLLLTRTAPQPSTARPVRVLPLLQFITTTLWKHLFGRPADALERSAANAAEYMISDNEPLVNSYISVPREMSQLNCAAYVAGIIEGVCDGAGFATQGVSAHWANEDPAKDAPAQMWPGKTVFLIRFAPEVLEREEILAKATA